MWRAFWLFFVCLPRVRRLWFCVRCWLVRILQQQLAKINRHQCYRGDLDIGFEIYTGFDFFHMRACVAYFVLVLFYTVCQSDIDFYMV